MAAIWRIGAGDKDKDLVPLMLEKGLMLIGPGDTDDITGLNRAAIKDKVNNIPNGNPRDKSSAGYLLGFRDAKNGEIVVLRLGSVCFAVGVIIGDYKWSDEFKKVYSYWNKEKIYRQNDPPWDLQHTRKVEWFILKDAEALCYFRRGIYGGQQRFCQVQDSELKNYLEEKLGYNGTNGREVLEKIGDRTQGVNKYGFPIS